MWALGCEKFLPDPAWLLLSKSGPPFSLSLYVQWICFAKQEPDKRQRKAEISRNLGITFQPISVYFSSPHGFRNHQQPTHKILLRQK